MRALNSNDNAARRGVCMFAVVNLRHAAPDYWVCRRHVHEFWGRKQPAQIIHRYSLVAMPDIAASSDIDWIYKLLPSPQNFPGITGWVVSVALEAWWE